MSLPNFQGVKLNRILENDYRIQSEERKDKLNQIREKKGKYSEMK